MKYILVTGGASGIGRVICEALAKRDYIVFAGDINEEGLKTFNNSNIIPLHLDISSDESIKKSFDEISKKTSKLDAIINNAGIIIMNTMIETDISSFQKVMDINLFGMVRVNKTFFPLLKNNSRIITISSETGWLKPGPFNGLYTVSKHAVEAYNDILRRELMFLGIKVIKIQPGSFKTAMHDQTKNSYQELLNKTTLFKRQIKLIEKTIDSELQKANDPIYLMLPILEALESPNPKISYKVKTSKRMNLLNKLSDKMLDIIYYKALK